MAKDVHIQIKGSSESRWTSSREDLIEFAHLIIAGAMGVGDPPVDPIPGWHDAARKWIGLFHQYLNEERPGCSCCA